MILPGMDYYAVDVNQHDVDDEAMMQLKLLTHKMEIFWPFFKRDSLSQRTSTLTLNERIFHMRRYTTA